MVWKDIYITQIEGSAGSGANILLRNEGDFNFTDVSAAAGVDNIGRGFAAIWGDFDNDGWLDLYVTNYTVPSLADDPVYRNKLYRNLGDGTFDDVSVGSGVDDPGLGLAAVFSDVNRNGWLDLYLANDKGHQSTNVANQSWRNVQGQFENTCDISGKCLGMWAMGIAAGDVTATDTRTTTSPTCPIPAGTTAGIRF